jgi:hypothetical protein
MVREIRTNPFIFRWAVNESGYKWAKGLVDKKPHLVSRTEQAGFRLRELKDGLFAEFAALSPTQDEIEHFAQEYGSNLVSTYDDLGDLVVREDYTATWGTSLEAWQSEISDMKALVRLWDDIRYRRLVALRKVIDWSDNGVGYKLCGRYINLAARDILLTVPLRRFVYNDVLLPAQYALQKEINRRLEAPRSATVPRLAWTPDNQQRLIFVPKNLLAAMWLQFAQAVTEELQLRACTECGKYFQVGPGANRADRKTCSERCRQRRKRKIG